MMITFTLILICLWDNSIAKICWKECDPSKKVIQSVDVANCTRRSTYPEFEDFWCNGEKGPPCFVQKGKTEVLEVVWTNPGVANMTQSAHWLTYIELPWYGMETEACPFLDGGKVILKTWEPRHLSWYFVRDADQMLSQEQANLRSRSK